MESLPAIAVCLSAIAAISSTTLAISVARLEHGRQHAQTFLEIVKLMQTHDMRSYKSVIYRVNRAEFGQWSEEETAAVDAWCARLDFIATLVIAGQVNRAQFFSMYGDVFVRTVYQVAPYAMSQSENRGNQFLLPLRRLTYVLPKVWQHQIRRTKYPSSIKIPTQSVELTPSLFKTDIAVWKFHWKSK